MKIGSKITLAAVMGLITLAGCTWNLDSGGRICIPFCVNTTDPRVPKEVADVEENGIRQAMFTIKFNRSILTSVDNFFSRYNDDSKDQEIEQFLASLADVGLRQVAKRFGASPDLSFVPDPKQYSVNSHLVYSAWVNASASPQAFKAIRPLLGKNTSAPDYRWRIGILPLFAYNRNIESQVLVVVFFVLEVEKKNANGRFVELTTLDSGQFTKVVEDLVEELLPAYKAYFKNEYGLEIL